MNTMRIMPPMTGPTTAPTLILPDDPEDATIEAVGDVLTVLDDWAAIVEVLVPL